MPLRLSTALLVAIAFAAPASAQVYFGAGSPPPGFAMIRPFPYYSYGYFGYYPSAFGSQWSNGYSLYGPPVPTYGPVAGAFGGSDQRLNYTRLDDPRPFVSRGPRSADDLVTLTFALIDLKLPAADAKVTVNGRRSPKLESSSRFALPICRRANQPATACDMDGRRSNEARGPRLDARRPADSSGYGVN